MSSSLISPEPSGRPAWMGRDGLPSDHVAKAALRVATLIDEEGSLRREASESYWRQATGGVFTPESLALGEKLLLDTGLLLRSGDRLRLSAALAELLDGAIGDAIAKISLEALSLSPPAAAPPALEALIDDPQRREEILLAREQRFDDSRMRLIGEIGEQMVLERARQELRELGRPELGREVRRLSLISDALGYDISAPRIAGGPRLIEVKATRSPAPEFEIYLSRNEARTGRQLADWFLVVCRVEGLEARSGRILGWCDAAAIAHKLPRDVPLGRWEKCAIEIAAEELLPDLPPATL